MAGEASDATEAIATRRSGKRGRVLVGMLTPSSNTVLEPMTARILAGMPEVSAHFGRFRVTEISLGASALDQFDDAPLLEAAQLLADAHVDVIAWNGTSGGWLGIERDRQLCLAVERATGVPATSSVLGLIDAYRRTGVRRHGLVTPYIDDVQARIVANFAREGFECTAERHANRRENFSFSEIGEAVISDMIREVAASAPQAISVLCTNMRGAALVDRLEREIGIPIYDTVATAIWASLRVAGVDTKRIAGWGRLFREVD